MKALIVTHLSPSPVPELAAKLRLVLAVHEIAEDGNVGIAVASKLEMEEMKVVR